MLANEQFKVMVTKEDRQMIRAVAEYFERSQGDTIRLIVREVYAVIQEKEQENQTPIRKQQAPA